MLECLCVNPKKLITCFYLTDSTVYDCTLHDCTLIGGLKGRVGFLLSSNWIIISCYFLNVAVASLTVVYYSWTSIIQTLHVWISWLLILDLPPWFQFFTNIDALAEFCVPSKTFWHQIMWGNSIVNSLNLSPLQNTNLKEFCAH